MRLCGRMCSCDGEVWGGRWFSALDEGPTAYLKHFIISSAVSTSLDRALAIMVKNSWKSISPVKVGREVVGLVA